MQEKPLTEYRQMPGVKDLPLKVGGHFALALKWEDMGDPVKAQEQLDKAIEAEAR